MTKINLKKIESIVDAQVESAMSGQYIDTKAIQCVEAADTLYTNMMDAACEMFNEENKASGINAQPSIYPSQETGNHAYEIKLKNKYGIVMSTISVAKWNETNGYLWSEKYRGNQVIIKKAIDSRLTWLKKNSKMRLYAKTEESMAEYTKEKPNVFKGFTKSIDRVKEIMAC